MSAINSTTLRGLFRGLEALYQTETGLDLAQLLILFEAERAPPEMLLFRESDDGELEVGLALDHGSLRRLEAASVEHSLGDAGLSDTLPILEGLSHLLYVAEAARTERPVSGLELETQAEVDKLAVCVLHRWPVAPSEFDRLVDRLYYRFEWDPLHSDLHERYEVANRLALAFSRQLASHVSSGRLSGFRATLRRFWNAPMGDKRALAGC